MTTVFVKGWPKVMRIDCTVLNLACQKANEVICASVKQKEELEEVKLLLNYGDDPVVKARSESEETLEIVRLLLDYGADPEVKAWSKSEEMYLTPLRIAVEKRNLPLTRVLLEGKASVNQTDDYRRSALHFCCIHRCKFEHKLEILEILIQHKANVNLQDAGGKTPLHFSCATKQYEMMRILLDNGASANIADKQGECPLHRAVRDGDIRSVEMLLAFEAHVNQTNVDGQSALHLCCQELYRDKPYLEILNVLISYKADVNLKDENGKTPLHLSITKYNCDLRKVAFLENEPQVLLCMLSVCAVRQKDYTELVSETYELMALWSAYADSFECMHKATLLRIKNNIPKRLLEPMECYGFCKEWETIEELETVRGDDKQLKLQAILAKERIHQGQHEELMALIQKDLISATLAASKSEAGELLKHHLNIWNRCNNGTEGQFYRDLLGAWNNELEEHFESFDTLSIVKLIQTIIENLPKPIYIYSFSLPDITTLIMKLYRRNRQVEDTSKNEGMLAKELLRQLLDSDLEGAPYPIQHLITKQNFRFAEIDRRSTKHISRTLCDYELIKCLLESGIQENAVDIDGNTILHSAVHSFVSWIEERAFLHVRNQFQISVEVVDPLRRTIKLLLDKGVFPNAQNKHNQTARDVLGVVTHHDKDEGCNYMEVRRRISDILQQYELQNSMTLKHMAAVAVKESGYSYEKFLPNALVEFVDLHKPRGCKF